MSLDGLSLATDSAGVSLGTLDDTAGAAALTLCAWIIPTSFDAGNPGCIMCHTNSTGNVGPWKLQIQDGGVGLRFVLGAGGSDTTITGTTVFSTGTRYFVAATYGGSNMRTFVNAVETQVGAKTGTVNSAPASNTRLFGVDDGASFRRKFNGVAEDFRIYTRRLSVAELETILNTLGRDNIVDGLLHRWRCNEGAEGTTASGAGTIKDSGSATFNGTPIFSPTYRASRLSFARTY